MVGGVVQSGTMKSFPTSTVPRGYFRKDASSQSTTTYAALFGVLGYIWGGSGANFNLPDDLGRVEVGDGTGSGLTNRTVAQKFGEEAHALTGAEDGPHTHAQEGDTMTLTGGVGSGSSGFGSLGPGYGYIAVLGGTTGSAGSGTPHNNMQPSTVYLKCIKY